MTELSKYYFLDDPAEREFLTNADPAEIRDNAHRIYNFMDDAGIGADSFTRELWFTKASEALGIDYNILYDAWVDQRPIQAPAPAPAPAPVAAQ